MGGSGKCRPIDVVSAFEQRHDSPSAVVVRKIKRDAGHTAEHVVAEIEATEQVVPTAVEAGRQDNEVGPKSAHDGEKQSVQCLSMSASLEPQSRCTLMLSPEPSPSPVSEGWPVPGYA